jgi:hypothetical protein
MGLNDEPGQRKRPHTTSTQPLSLREGHLASDNWWNPFPSPGYMLLYKDELTLCGS